jgi:hypothetical protein
MAEVVLQYPQILKRRMWFGITATVNLKSKFMHKAGFGNLLVPHPAAVNWLLRRPCCGMSILTKQTTTTGGTSHDHPYTTFLKNSKMNLLFLEKATNAESGLSTRSSRSSFPLLLPRLPICCVACKRFSALPAYPKNAFTPSWLRQRYLGGGCGNRYGR